ncbi:uncharacterized protein At4g14450, chloroplastic-like [Diospyros lotus]|uniref:uncharacterized protein At4g14450, chloroplastic-like n=1 Tax=Diospyros lotus TaxID=55363 RepID=UPI0022591CB3|nr:uncharacterized protein At4g14450, chloroplastic-like [Diospyros lotus]
MAETQRSSSCDSRQASRLRNLSPPSMQISRVSDWKIAIPLLSPLATSPSSDHLTEEEVRYRNNQVTKEEIVFKKWVHPAAPFGYDPAPPPPPPAVPFVLSRP